MKFNKKSLLYGTFILTTANFIVRILGFVYRIFLSRMIGPQGMGLVQLIFPVYMISVTLTASGIPIAISRIVAQRKSIGDEQGIKTTVHSALFLISIISFFICAIIVLCVDTIAEGILHDIRTRIPLLVLFPCILITGVGAIFKGYFYGLKEIQPSAIAEVMEQIVRIILVTAILLNIPSLNEQGAAAVVIFGMVIGELISCMYLHYRYNQNTKGMCDSNNTPSKRAIYKLILSISIPVTLTRLVSSFMTAANAVLIPQRLIVSGMSHEGAVGLFGIVSGMVMPLLFLPFTLISALSVIIIPNLSENVMLKNWAMIRDKVSKSIFITCLTAFISMAFLIPLAHPLGMVLYKQITAGKYLMVLSYAIIFICIQHNSSSILNGLGKQNRAAAHFILGGIFQLLCTYFLIPNPDFGIYGFIIGFMGSSILVSFLNLITVIRTTKLQFRWVKWIVEPAAACYATALIIRLCNLFLIRNGMSQGLALAITIPIGLSALIIILLSIGSLPFWIVTEIRNKLGLM